MRKVYHLFLKSDSSHHYYGSLTALKNAVEIGVSLNILYRYDFNTPFENEICIIRKGYLITTGSPANH